MKYIANASVLTFAFLLTSCGIIDGQKDGKSARVENIPAAAEQTGVSDFPVKIGETFTVGSKSYTPQDVANYDEVGYASWYGNELAGRPTANGETFAPDGVSVAHKTLPLPSYVEITALDTGKTIIARVNDRGPFANDRLVDLSAGAARQLGIIGQGVAGVRVRKINPPEQDKAVLRSGRPAVERISTPESLLKILREKLAQQPKPSGVVRKAAAPVPSPIRTASAPTPAPVPAPAPSGGRFVREGQGAQTARIPAPRAEDTRPVAPVAAPARATLAVQIGSYESRARAEDLARKAGALVQQSPDGRLFRVRYGPFATQAEADKALSTARAKGYAAAKIFSD
jgi:rare lipoprotein A